MREVFQQVAIALSSKFGGSATISGEKSLSGGCIHHATRIETNVGVFFLKWNSRCAHDLFIREAECLAELKKADPKPLIIPEVIAAKAVDNTPGFLLMEYLEPGDSPQQDERLGEGLANLHRRRTEKFGFAHDNYCGATPQDNTPTDSWAEFFSRRRIQSIVRKIGDERGISSNDLKIYEKLIDKIPSLLPSESAPALIHGDLWAGNYMFTQSGPALIDPASYCADREMEMGIMTMFGGFSQRFWSAYNYSHPLLPDWKERNRLYQLYHVLNHYYLFGGNYGGEALQIARKYI